MRELGVFHEGFATCTYAQHSPLTGAAFGPALGHTGASACLVQMLTRASSRARGATLRAEGGSGWRATPSSCGTQPPEGQLTAPGLGPLWPVSGSALPLARASAEESVLVLSLLLSRQALWDQAVSL